MIRVCLAIVTLAVVPLVSLAQEAVRLNVRPMAAPKPALKYLLLPEVRELNPGNPAQYYLRCFAEQRNFFFSKEATTARTNYLAMPLPELAKAKLDGYGGSALRQADWAARLDPIDWEVLQRVQTEGMDLLLPELGPLRILGLGLKVRFRSEVAERNYENAVRSAKTMLALARHFGDYPAEAANRNGLWVADQAVDVLEEMVQQPGCPNLYWALTDLPSPLVDLRKGFQGMRSLVSADLEPLRSNVPMTEAEIEKLVSHLSGSLGFARQQAGQAPRSLRAELKARLKGPERVQAAAARLVEAGLGEAVRKYPPGQIILLDEKRDYETRRDESMKVLSLAPWQIDALGVIEPAPDGLFTDLLPQVIKGRRAQALLEQRLGMVRHVEALRLYAAGHDGKFPAKLTDVGVPLPLDPFTGKPYVYLVEGVVAHLRAGPPAGDEKNAGAHLHYELTMQK
jgi:hypothetical protein